MFACLYKRVVYVLQERTMWNIIAQFPHQHKYKSNIRSARSVVYRCYRFDWKICHDECFHNWPFKIKQCLIVYTAIYEPIMYSFSLTIVISMFSMISIEPKLCWWTPSVRLYVQQEYILFDIHWKHQYTVIDSPLKHELIFLSVRLSLWHRLVINECKNTSSDI